MTKVIDKNEVRLPFFGDRLSFVRGLDPLGLQNPSAQAYSYLLPGLNNVTGRLRSYSFYCWLLTEYARQIQTTDPKEQKRFVRRAEYILALIAAHADTNGVAGSLYALRQLNQGETSFNIGSATYNPDGSTTNTYWQYSFGVFGQYYLGSIRQIGLIEEPLDASGNLLGIYRRTSSNKELLISGEALAAAFDENVSPENKGLFLSCLRKGTIDLKQVEKLTPDFNLAHIRTGTEEHNLLLQLMLDLDEPANAVISQKSMRKATLLHVLRYADTHKSGVEQRKFTFYAYQAKGEVNHHSDDCLFGWYYYQLNEYWQVACTAILNGLLDYLQEREGPGWMLVQELLQESTKEITELLIQGEVIDSGDVTIAEALTANLDPEQVLYQDLMRAEGVVRMAMSFALIWQLYQQNKQYLDRLEEYTSSIGIDSKHDVVSFCRKFDRYVTLPVHKFLEEFLLSNIIYRHQYVAYHKIGGGSQSTQKFIIEDNHIRHIGNFDPGFTGPRIRNLINFLQDLGLLDAEGRLTDAGQLQLAQN
ncbi:hypothetical protein [Rufibacter hautae]|uniref:Uncharacterized protein n=1 Tax=Rufibacter hautae TaxID=2595005 RepID=A0A5B6TER0_9BACT|nr:hypothetical protein [Rufibacter hautae]KAA3437672.1 hypothetical protein FOA19_10220 [Rufibacter hautae]